MSVTSNAGESAGVSSGQSVFKVHEADASGRWTADVFRRRRHAGGRWQLEGHDKVKLVTDMEYYCWRLMQRDGQAWTSCCAVTGCSSSTLSTPVRKWNSNSWTIYGLVRTVSALDAVLAMTEITPVVVCSILCIYM